MDRAGQYLPIIHLKLEKTLSKSIKEYFQEKIEAIERFVRENVDGDWTSLDDYPLFWFTATFENFLVFEAYRERGEEIGLITELKSCIADLKFSYDITVVDMASCESRKDHYIVRNRTDFGYYVQNTRTMLFFYPELEEIAMGLNTKLDGTWENVDMIQDMF